KKNFCPFSGLWGTIDHRLTPMKVRGSMLRRNFLGQIPILGAVGVLPICKSAGPSCQDRIASQWSNAMDDDRDIDDSSDDFPLWNGGERKPGTDSDQQRSCLAAIGFYLKSRIDGNEATENRNAAYQILAAPHYRRFDVEQQFRTCA